MATHTGQVDIIIIEITDTNDKSILKRNAFFCLYMRCLI